MSGPNDAVVLIGTIVETEDHYGTCWVQIDWPDGDDWDHMPGEGRIWLPIPHVVNDPGDIPGYEGRRVSVTVAMLEGDRR